MEQPVERSLSNEISSEKIAQSLDLVIAVYKGFRDELMASYGDIDFTLKPDHSQLTELDIKVETTLKSRLSDTFPEFGFQGEETGKLGNTKAFWLADPIDGTISFIRGLPNCTNMAALIVNNQPVAAVIYNFPEDQLYTAIAGQGAFKNGQPIHVSSRPITNTYIDNWNSSLYSDIYQFVKPHGIRTLQPIGASGRSFSLIAEGKLDGGILIKSPAAVHDRAPGALIITEAGGEIVTFDTTEWDIYTENYLIGAPAVAAFFRDNKGRFKQLIIDE